MTTPAPPPREGSAPARGLARRLGPFDATMLVMGGIVGSRIFVTPHVDTRQVHTPALIVGIWAGQRAVALAEAFVYADLTAVAGRLRRLCEGTAEVATISAV